MNKNLNHKLTVSEQRKGGKASVKKRKEKKAVRELMTAILDGKVKDNQQFAKLADKLGINDNKSIKEVYTLVCLLNSTKKSNLSDLERLVRLLCEDNAKEVNNGILDELTEYLKNTDKLTIDEERSNE